ncbi:MAG: hypothetical protein AAFQ19_09265 [Pseudomonadota bacterium]
MSEDPDTNAAAQRPKLLDWLQVTALLLTVTFFVILLASALVPSTSLFQIDAQSDRMEFRVPANKQLRIDAEQVFLQSGANVVSDCSSGFVLIGGGMTVVLERINNLPALSIERPDALRNDDALADFYSDEGTFDLLRDQSNETASPETVTARVFPNSIDSCGAFETPEEHFGPIPIEGIGTLGPAVQSSYSNLDPVWIAGDVTLFTESLLCFHDACSLFDVAEGAAKIPAVSNIEPVLFEWTYMLRWVPGVEPLYHPAPLRGIAQVSDGRFAIGLSTEADALKISTSGFGRQERYLRVGILEQLMAEPILALLLSLFPSIGVSLSILNRDGTRPSALLAWCASIVTRPAGRLFRRR